MNCTATGCLEKATYRCEICKAVFNCAKHAAQYKASSAAHMHFMKKIEGAKLDENAH